MDDGKDVRLRYHVYITATVMMVDGGGDEACSGKQDAGRAK